MSVFKYAPGPKVVDGLTAVPIHIDQVTGTMVFNGSSKTASCTAVLQFTVGPDGGYPFFDLRQTISTAKLDGVSFPVADLDHHDFGGGPDSELRVIEQWLAAGTSHTLELTYALGTPQAPNARAIIWEPSSARLSFSFHLSDLNPSRYLESWLPSNLLFDNFPVSLEVQLTNTSHAHTLLSNGAVTSLGSNHWQVEFPAAFASCSPLLLIEASDRVVTHTATVAIGGGTNLTLELMKRATDTSLDLATEASTLAGYLTDYHTGIGAYMHGNRFVAYLTSGSTHSMEYDGGTTSSLSALRHEVFHSWWARGMLPARGADGWLDEAFTTWNTGAGAYGSTPLDMTAPPLALWVNNPFKRKTHGSSYGNGSAVFAGIAADIGVNSLKSHMAGIYQDRLDRRITTPELEAELIRRSGELQIANYFERFVYGFGNPVWGTHPDLYLRDATDDDGTVPYSGTFWRSPDVWVRNADDGGTTPQDPESGQDNWFYARVSNRGTATAHTFVVGFKIRVWAGTEFVYPGDWFPLTAAVVGFDLAPGESQIVKARWPEADIPSTGSHGCLLAMVVNPHDAPAAGKHVWEHNNLAQRNMTVVNLVMDEWAEFSFFAGSRYSLATTFHSLELVRPPRWPKLEAEITHRRPRVVEDLFRSFEKLRSIRKVEPQPALEVLAPPEIRLRRSGAVLRPAPGSKLTIDAAGSPALRVTTVRAALVKNPAGGLSIRFDAGAKVAFPIALDTGDRRGMVLRLRAPRGAKPGDQLLVDLVQRDGRGRAVGGITVQINVIGKPTSREAKS